MEHLLRGVTHEQLALILFPYHGASTGRLEPRCTQRPLNDATGKRAPRTNQRLAPRVSIICRELHASAQTRFGVLRTRG